MISFKGLEVCVFNGNCYDSKQSIDWKYKIMMTLVVCLFSIVGILVYWLLLRPAIKKRMYEKQLT